MSQAFKKLLPSLNRILVKRPEPIQKTASGIILSKSSQPNIATVIAAGPGQFDEKGARIPMSIKVGDTVLLPDYSGTKVELAEGEYYLYRDSDVLGTLDEKK